MNENKLTIEQLLEKLTVLMTRQESFHKEIEELRLEIEDLRSMKVPAETQTVIPVQAEEQPVVVPVESVPIVEEPGLWKKAVENSSAETTESPHVRTNIEKFIGENLINKIGIVILVIGVGIGAKYAIDHDLISPLTRIILGYILGLGLMGFAIRLKKQ